MNGFTVWFTGLPGSGKSTLARMLEGTLLERGLNVEVLDGDEVRTNLSQGLGFSKQDRDTNIQRIGYVCRLLSRNKVVAISAAISPYREVRDQVRAQIGRFVEVYTRCSVDTLKERDPKGLYAKALAGEITNFTGISDPYEEPHDPEVTVDTGVEPAEGSLQKILHTLELIGYIPPSETDEEYSPEEEEKIKARLRSLGYL